MNTITERPTRAETLRHILIRTAAVPLLALAAGACSDGRSDLSLEPDLGRIESGTGMINVSGYKLHATVQGKGTPAVVLLSGLDETTESWSQVRPEVARWTRVVVYDRGGVDRSDLPKTERRSAEEVAAELERLLERADVKPPYILVGHSISGYYARVYAARNPKKVAGLVFLDAQHESAADMIRGIPDYEEVMRQIAGGLYHPGSRSEFLSSLTSADQARDAAFPRVPVAAVTFMDPEDPDAAEMNFVLQGEWVAKGSIGLHLVTEAGHRVPSVDPEVTLQAIRWALDNAGR